jgi:hypothetical protein
MSETVLTQGVLFIGGGAALWFSLRLKVPEDRVFHVIIKEIAYTTVLGIAIGGILPLLTAPLGLWETLDSTKYTVK